VKAAQEWAAIPVELRGSALRAMESMANLNDATSKRLHGKGTASATDRATEIDGGTAAMRALIALGEEAGQEQAPPTLEEMMGQAPLTVAKRVVNDLWVLARQADRDGNTLNTNRWFVAHNVAKQLLREIEGEQEKEGGAPR